MLEFPAASFEVDGEPETIRETSRSYGRFATTTGQASSDIRSLNSGEWVGTEGELFRAGISHLPPHYDTAHTAFGQVSQALSGFATELDTMKSQMRTLRTEAEHTFASLKSAQQARSDLKEPSGDHDSSAKSAYEQHKNSLDGRISGLESTWQQHLTNATNLRNQAQEAAGRTGQAIRAAGRTSPTADQNWLERNLEAAGNWISDRIDDIKNFVKEHAGAFRWIATALKWVGGALMAAAGIAMVVAAFVPVLGWLAELPLAAIFATGAFLYGAGDTLDTTVDWAEGKISGTELLIRAGVSLVLSIVGAAAAKPIIKGLEKLATKFKKWVGDLIEWAKKKIGVTPNGPPWPVKKGVPGSASGKILKPPNARHTIAGAKHGQVKPQNSVILRGNEQAINGDVQKIAEGKARWNPQTNRYEINGRSYGVEPSGTVFPDSGPGIVKLDRNEYAALKEIAKADGDLSKAPALSKDPRFVNNPQAVAKAKAIYDGTYP